MATRKGKPSSMKNNKASKLLKKNFDIEERYTKALTVLSAITGKDLSQLVNEALSLLIEKYQPNTNTNLLKVRENPKLNSHARFLIRVKEHLKKLKKDKTIN